MRRRRGGLAPFTAGLIALVITAGAVYFGFTKAIPFRDHHEIRAAFRSANGIKSGSPVRIAGVEVGEVSQVEATEPGGQSAWVTMRIEDRGKPIHADATAKIRPRIFLEGNFFVDLSPGSPPAPELEDGDEIPASQTSTPVQFDQVLAILQQPTREDLRLTLGELADAYEKGFAEAFNSSLEDQAPAYRFSAIVLEAMLGRRPHDLSNFVRDMGTVSKALDASPPRLKSFLENFNTFAASLARERQALGAAVEELPRTLAAAGPALDALNRAFPPTRRFAATALPAVRSSGPAIAAARPLVNQLRGLVGRDELRGLAAGLGGAAPPLTTLAQESVPVLRQFRELAACTTNTLVPWSEDTVPDENFPAAGPVFQTGVKWLPAAAGESRSFDANGQWFKVLGSGGIETFQFGEGLFGVSALPVVGVNPPKPKGRPPLNPEAPCEDQQTPDLRSKPGQPPQRAKADWSSPAAQRRYARSRQSALAWLRSTFEKEGIDVRIDPSDATLPEIEDLARRNGNADQLGVLRREMTP